MQTAASLPPRSIEFEQECVRFFEEIVQIFDVPKSVGQIYGLLYASPLPLSFSDIVEKLEISKGSASQGLWLLRSLGAINVANTDAQVSSFSAPPSSRVTYEPELSLRRLVGGVLRERITPLAGTGTKRLEYLRIGGTRRRSQTVFSASSKAARKMAEAAEGGLAHARSIARAEG